MTVPHCELSSAEARHLAVVASFGGSPHPGSLPVLRQLGLLQLDPLARVAKAHRLTCLARMRPDAAAGDIDDQLWSDGKASAFETWVHAACLVPIEDWPLLQIARDRVIASPRRPPKAALDEVLALVADTTDGATISDIEQPGTATRGWDWSDRKRATEFMLRTGDLICSSRRGVKRLFDLPERRVSRSLLDTRCARENILASLARNALAAMGIATASDVATYYNLAPADALTGLNALGARPVTVESWKTTAWMPPQTATSAPLRTDPVLIGPFDNLIWDRDRVRRIFGFDYLFEAYKPQAKRKYGYYVLALLDDGQFTGRADIRRDGDGLTILAAHPEPSTSPARFSRSLETATSRLQAQLLRGLPSDQALAGARG